jgi:hypothetical protein
VNQEVVVVVVDEEDVAVVGACVGSDRRILVEMDGIAGAMNDWIKELRATRL